MGRRHGDGDGVADMGRAAAVVGSGVMGADIALSLALGGWEVAVWGRRAAGAAAAAERVASNAGELVRLGLATADEARAARGRVATTTVLPDAVGGAALVLEAVAENLDLKRRLLAEAETSATPSAVLSSTTTGLSPTAIGEALARPERFCVAHYAQPAHLVTVVEVVPGQRTAEHATATLEEWLRATGKVPVRVADVPGFLWARLQSAVLRELLHLVRRGDVTVETCDLLVRRGYASRLPAMGPFEHADLAGLELTRATAARVWPDLASDASPDGTALTELLAAGRSGMDAGTGFYDWRERDPDAFRAARDREITNRLRLDRGGHVADPDLDDGTTARETS